MELNEVLTRLAEAIENVEDYEKDFDYLRTLEKPEGGEAYDDLKEKYDSLKEKYRKRFVESLTEEVKADKPKRTEDVEENDNVRYEDLDLSGEND